MAFNDYSTKKTGLFLKIESGKPQVIRLLQDSPSERLVHGFGLTEMKCEEEGCSFCAELDDKGKPKNRSRRRFKLNIYNHDEGKVMLWDFGPSIMHLLQDIELSLKTQNENILNTDLIVNARGEKMEKEYSVQVCLRSKAVPADLELFPLEPKSSIPF